MCDQQSLRSACASAQSDQSLCLSLAYSMNVKLLTEHYLEFLSLKGDCTGSSVKMPHCWTSHVATHITTIPDGGLLNGTKLSNFMKYCYCSAHFLKGKILHIPWKFCFSSIQTVHVFTIIYFVPALQHPYENYV